MTSSGLCHECGKVAHAFHYRTPRKTAFDGHDGFWHCPEHGPEAEVIEEKAIEQKPKDPLHGMNRAERRLYARKGIIRA